MLRKSKTEIEALKNGASGFLVIPDKQYLIECCKNINEYIRLYSPYKIGDTVEWGHKDVQLLHKEDEIVEGDIIEGTMIITNIELVKVSEMTALQIEKLMGYHTPCCFEELEVILYSKIAKEQKQTVSYEDAYGLLVNVEE